MGNGLFNPPPTNGTTLPDVPVADFVSTGQQVATGFKQADLWTSFWRKFWSMVAEGIHKLLEILAGGMDDIIAAYLGVIGGLKGTNQPGFFNLIATLLHGLLGVEVSYETIQASFNAAGSVPAMRTIGGNVFQAWAGILAPGGGTDLQGPGVAAAEAWVGWLLEYAVKHGNMAVLSTLIPEQWRVLEGVSEYGHAIGQTLGLGRLSRQALMPLIRTLIADPLQRDLNTAYAPKQLSEGELVRAFTRGAIDSGALRQHLGWLGYASQWDAVLIAEHSKALGLHELIHFLRATDPSAAPPVGALQVLGYAPSDAQNVWTAALEGLVDPLRKTFLHEITGELRKGEIDLPTALGILGTLNLFPQEAEWYRQIWTQMLSFPRRVLTESQVETAYLEGLITISEAQAYWQQRGYSPGDLQVLTLLLLQKQQGGKKTSAGHKPIKHLTEAELEKAFKGGLMTLAQLEAYWALLGYSQADIQVLAALVQAPPSSPTTTGA